MGETSGSEVPKPFSRKSDKLNERDLERLNKNASKPCKQSKPCKPNKQNKRNNKKSKNNRTKWVIMIWISSFLMSIVFSIISTSLLSRVDVAVAFIVLISIIIINILFDLIGTASTAADETPFHSMAAKKVEGAKEALKLIKNADKVSNFCNDVIGDICGIISGSATTYIVIKIIENSVNKGVTFETIIEVVLTGLVAAVTVGGKSIGKATAIKKSNEIIFSAARIIRIFKRR